MQYSQPNDGFGKVSERNKFTVSIILGSTHDVEHSNLIKDYLLFNIFPEISIIFSISINLLITANAFLNNYNIHNLMKVLEKHRNVIN